MDNEKSFNNKLLRQRFVKDYNLPINIYLNPYFDYYRKLYDFFPNDVWENLLKKIETEFDGNVELWLNYCAGVRDSAIIKTMETEEYKKFNSCDSKIWDLPKEVPLIGEHSVFNEENHGRYFVSIDLKKANFQALKYVGVINDETYADFVHRHGGDEYIANSKYLRQVIFGKMNPGRTVKVEKYIMGRIYMFVHEIFEDNGYEFFSLNSDEIIFRGKENEWKTFNEDKCKRVERYIHDMLDIDARVEHYWVERLDIINSNGNKVDAYVRHLHNGEPTLKKVSTTFYPQIYKLWKGMKIEPIDLGFFFDDQIATFNDQLRFRDGDK